MTIVVTFAVEHFDEIPRKFLKRYVRTNSSGDWYWCEFDTLGYDVRQGRCDENDVDVDTAARARDRARSGIWPAWVDWS